MRYREKTANCRNLCKNKKKNSFKKFISDIEFDTPPGVVWNKIQSLKGYNTPTSGPIEQNGTIITDPKEK